MRESDVLSHGHGEHQERRRHDSYDHCHHDAARASRKAALVVTINPEARIEVQQSGKEVDTLEPGKWADISFLISNEGYVTGPLQIMSAPVRGVEIDAPLVELTGRPAQETHFRVRLAEPGAVDLTVRFWALGALGGLANKNTSHLYLRCRQVDPVDTAFGDQPDPLASGA